MENKSERVCKGKNCDCILPSTSKSDYCAKCEGERNNVLKKIFMVIGTVVVAIATFFGIDQSQKNHKK